MVKANLERELNFDSVDGYVTANHNATNTSSGSASFFGLIGGSAKKYWKSASSRNSDSISNSNGGLKNRLRRKHSIHADALLFVKNSKGGKIVSDDSALAAWSVDAIRIVRDQLYSATSDASPLPFFQNWPREKHRFSQEDQAAAIRSDIQKNCDHLSDDEDPLQNSMMSNGSSESELFQKKNALNESMPRQNLSLPLWALDEATNSISASDINVIKDEDRSQVLPYVEEASKSITIKDLSLFISELRELINSMETAMHTQRKRRVDKLKPPSRLKRNWYVIAIVVPTTAYIFYNTVMKENDGVKLLAKEVYQKISSFCAEHVSEPLQSIYRELFTRRGREDVTDKKARDNTIEILKKMIKSWLDETFPDMVESKRESMANAMDMCLIEDKKEFSIKNIFEINNIVRMSLIEMQFIKKEMMNALVQMDELMGSNEINIKLAAMTPAFILAKSIQVAGKQLFYVLLKIRKSKEQTYASFRHIILDIERLLVMRDNPPSTPLPLTNGAVSYLNRESEGVDIIPGGLSGSPTKSMFSDAPVATINHNDAISSVLNSDDLGMLILLVHEGRQILWQDRRRFSRQELRNISEDLAELAGERGAVSVRQQLRIIARMCRTYSFLDSSKIKMDQVAL